MGVDDCGLRRAMDPAEIPHLFEMFTRGDRVRSSHQGGLGIGLALARRLAVLHGGSLDAHSEGLGKGSVFNLRLPLQTDAPGDAARAGGTDAIKLSLRVLLADDNQDVGNSLAEALRLFGAHVHETTG